MEAFSPDFSERWLAGESSAEGPEVGGDAARDAQAELDQVMEALVERVNAARTIY